MTTAKILVVDDELELERLIKQRFRKRIRAKEFDFLFASNGIEALDKLQQEHHIDLVLTDIKMPDMDGLTLLGLLPTIDQNLKAVVVSAYSDIPNIRAAMNRGAFDFLTKPIDFQDLELTIQKSLASVQQIKEQQQSQAKLQDSTVRNSSIRLPDRSWFIDRLSKVINQQKQILDGFYAVLLIDLDRSQVVHDNVGCIAGERFLKIVADRLKCCVRDPDIVARFGENKFAILLESIANVKDAKSVAERIQRQLQLPFQLDGYEIFFTRVSIGIVPGSVGYQKPEDLLQDANVALYRAKAQSNRCYEVFSSEIQANIVDLLPLENALQQSVFQERLCLHYQPIISFLTGRLNSFEILARWRHTYRGLVSPTEFIPLAEASGLIAPLSWWILRSACEQLKRWQQEFPKQSKLAINVNLSSVQLKQMNFVEQIEQILHSTGLEGNHLKIEITERSLLEDGDFHIKPLKQLKALGIQICVDDFGTGYSALSRLHEFPIDILKIDRSFVRCIDEDSGSLETVKMIVTLAHSLEMDVVAEGVETISQLSKLQQLGCEFVQGYLFSRPVDSQEASRLLRQNSQFQAI